MNSIKPQNHDLLAQLHKEVISSPENGILTYNAKNGFKNTKVTMPIFFLRAVRFVNKLCDFVGINWEYGNTTTNILLESEQSCVKLRELQVSINKEDESKKYVRTAFITKDYINSLPSVLNKISAPDTTVSLEKTTDTPNRIDNGKASNARIIPPADNKGSPAKTDTTLAATIVAADANQSNQKSTTANSNIPVHTGDTKTINSSTPKETPTESKGADAETVPKDDKKSAESKDIETKKVEVKESTNTEPEKVAPDENSSAISQDTATNPTKTEITDNSLNSKALTSNDLIIFEADDKTDEKESEKARKLLANLIQKDIFKIASAAEISKLEGRDAVTQKELNQHTPGELLTYVNKSSNDCVLSVESLMGSLNNGNGQFICSYDQILLFTIDLQTGEIQKSSTIKTGDCPPGKMSITYENNSLFGHSDYGHYKIQYYISGGTRDNDIKFNSNNRMAYIPATPDGTKLLAAYIIAWKHKLIFTVGRSVSSGKDNVITWADIHHKTQLHKGADYGFPAPDYIRNTFEELQLKGITQDLITQEQLDSDQKINQEMQLNISQEVKTQITAAFKK